MNTSTPTPSRRAVARTAAWSVPVLLASTAAPAASASTPPRPVTTADCPNCLIRGRAAASTLSAPIIRNYRGTLAGTVFFALTSSSQCDLSLFDPGYTLILDKAVLTMTSGRFYTNQWTNGLPMGAGSFSVASTFSPVLSFPNVYFPSGAYSPAGAPDKPRSIQFTFRLRIIGLGGGIIDCPYTWTYNFSSLGTSGGLVSSPAPFTGLGGGYGTVTYVGTLS
jgi:hypothetical protein